MSSGYLFQAVKQHDVTASEKLVLICLANRSDKNGQCYPSIKTIAEDCCCSNRSVSRSIAGLIKKNMLESKPKYKEVGNGFKQSSNLYTLKIGVTKRHDPHDRVSYKTIKNKPIPRGLRRAREHLL